MAEDGELESQRFHARPLSKRCQHPDWFILQEPPAPSPYGAMATGDGGGIEPPGSDPAARKAGYSKATVSPAHPLATEPGAPVRFTFRERRAGAGEPPGTRRPERP
jgi:hypothetical protein